MLRNEHNNLRNNGWTKLHALKHYKRMRSSQTRSLSDLGLKASIEEF